MSGAKFLGPGTSARHAGRGSIGATVIKAAAAAGRGHRHTLAITPANRPLTRRQDRHTTEQSIGVDDLQKTLRASRRLQPGGRP